MTFDVTSQSEVNMAQICVETHKYATAWGYSQSRLDVGVRTRLPGGAAAGSEAAFLVAAAGLAGLAGLASSTEEEEEAARLGEQGL